MPQVGFEPIVPAFERAKTVHALDGAANVIMWSAPLSLGMEIDLKRVSKLFMNNGLYVRKPQRCGT
jgi:hypothetical protein